MILRRLSEHLRAQNWFAVTLDFIIVVLGVFIGTQVSNWNAARHDHARAADYTRRLAADLDYEAARHDASRDYYGEVRDNARRAAAALGAAPGASDAMSDEGLLISLYRASQYFYFPQRRATFDEIISTGDIRLVADQSMREAAIIIFADATIETVFEEAKSSDFRRLFRRMTPAPVQDALLRRCGDRDVPPGDVAAPAVLDYPCTLELPAAAVAAAAANLRSNADLLEALQLRLADLDTAMVNIETTAPGRLSYFRERGPSS